MKFVMWVCADPDVVPDPADTDPEPWVSEMEARGVRLEGNRLRSASDATTVRDHGSLVTDGPFAETREQIGGYDLMECADLAEAIQVAAKHPVARWGAIEVRQVWAE